MAELPTRSRKNITAGNRMLFNELGRTGLKHHTGTLYEEFLPHLTGTRGVAKYKEMRDNSAIVGSMLFAVESLLRSVRWDVEPASESPEDLAAAEFLRECQQDTSHTWEDFIAEVLSMLVFGWSYFEQVYKIRRGPKQKNPKFKSKYNDGRIGWRKFALRSQDTLFRWELQDDGGIKGMIQQPPPGQYGSRGNIFLPIEKCLLFRTTSHKNSPEGRSILRNAYRSYFFATKQEELESIGMERDLAGMPVMWVPIDVLAESKSEEAESTYQYLKDIVTRVKRDEQEGLLLPLAYNDDGKELYKFELLSTGGRRSLDIGAAIQRNNQSIALTILADFVLLGHENVGSFALSSDKTELFAIALGSWLDTIQETINRHAVPTLFELNTFQVEQYPRFIHGDIEKPNLAELATYIRELTTAGAPMFPDLVLENKLREYAELPEADPEERDKIIAQQEQQMQQQQASPNGSKAIAKMLEDYVDEMSFDDEERQIVEDITKGNPFRTKLKPSYFDGTEWKTIRGRHQWVGKSNGDS